jgi:hypothetical protein
MQKRLKPQNEKQDAFHFYCKIHNPTEVQLLREVSQDLGWPSNSALIHLMAKAYAANNLERMQ